MKNDGVLIRRVGIVLLIVSILMVVSAVLLGTFAAYLWLSIYEIEDSIAKIFIVIFLPALSIAFGFAGVILLVIGLINLGTSIALLKSGTDLNIIKTKKRRIAFCNFILYLTCIIAIIAGAFLFLNEQAVLAILAFAVAIVMMALGITLSKALNTIKKMNNEEAE